MQSIEDWGYLKVPPYSLAATPLKRVNTGVNKAYT
jgi:hypothetical protein